MKKFLVLMVLVAACGGGERKKQLDYIPGDLPDAGIFLRLVTLDDQSLTLEVVGNGITNLYGLAFRLQYDPAVLDFTEMTPAADWPAEAISIAHETQTGILVAAITSRGPATGLNFSDQVLATLKFNLLAKQETCIAFLDNYCSLVCTDESLIPGQTWSGGRLEL